LTRPSDTFKGRETDREGESTVGARALTLRQEHSVAMHCSAFVDAFTSELPDGEKRQGKGEAGAGKVSACE
jgi:hypothetical protein